MIDWAALRLSFEVALLGTAIALVLGVGIAGVLAHARFFGRDFVDALVTAPLVLPPTVLGYYALTLVGRESSIGRAWESVTGAPIVFTKSGLVVAAVLAALPLVVKSARAAMEQVDPRLRGAARTLGAGPVRVFFSVVLPLARHGVVAGATLGFARALGDFGVTLLLAGNIAGRTRTAALSIYDAVMIGDDAAANGLAAVLAATAVGAVTLANLLSRKRDSDV